MAQVPYHPVPTATASAPGEQVSVQTTPEQFGANIGAALTQVGGAERSVGAAWEQFGGDIFNSAIKIQELQNESDARNAASSYAEQQAMLQAKYDSLPQAQAVASLPDHLAASRALREQFRGQLGSPNAKRMYDSQTFGFLERNVYSSARHAGDEERKYIQSGYQATQVSTLSQIAIHPDDDGFFERTLDQHLDAVRQEAKFVHGLADTPENDEDIRVKAAVETATRSAIISRVQGIARTNVDLADKMIERYKPQLGPAAATLQDYVNSKSTAIASSNIVDEIRAKHRQPDGTSDVTEAQEAEEVKAIAADRHPANQLLPKASAAELKSRVMQDNWAAMQDRRETYTGLDKLIAEHPEITDWQGLIANPQGDMLARKLAALGLPHDGDAITNRITLARAHEYGQVWDTNFANSKALSHSDLGTFLNTDFGMVNLKPAQRAELQGMQAKLAQDPSKDPRVSAAMNTLTAAYGPAMVDMNVNPREKAKLDSDYNTFKGTLQESLEVWAQEHGGKAPTAEDIKGPIWEEVKQKHMTGMLGDHWWNVFEDHGYKFSSYHRPSFENVPQEVVDEARKDGVSKFGVAPSDTAIAKAYARKLYTDTFSHTPAAGKAARQPGAPSGGPPAGPE